MLPIFVQFERINRYVNCKLYNVHMSFCKTKLKFLCLHLVRTGAFIYQILCLLFCSSPYSYSRYRASFCAIDQIPIHFKQLHMVLSVNQRNCLLLHIFHSSNEKAMFVICVQMHHIINKQVKILLQHNLELISIIQQYKCFSSV